LEVKRLINLNDKDRESLERIQQFKWDRSLYKSIIMTIPYNATAYGATDKITKHEDITRDVVINSDTGKTKHIYTYKNHPFILYNEDIVLFVKIIFKVVIQDFDQIKKLLDYLRAIAKLCNHLSIPITWHLPQGLVVKQGYLDKKSISLSVFSYTKATLNIVKSNNKTLDKIKQSRSLMPNLIHSLDAASMTLLFNAFSKNSDNDVNLFSVHDCFATTSNNVPLLMSTLKDVYISIYKDSKYIQTFYLNIINTIKLQYGDDCVWNDETRTWTIGKDTFYIPKVCLIYHNLPLEKPFYHVV